MWQENKDRSDPTPSGVILIHPTRLFLPKPKPREEKMSSTDLNVSILPYYYRTSKWRQWSLNSPTHSLLSLSLRGSRLAWADRASFSHRRGCVIHPVWFEWCWCSQLRAWRKWKHPFSVPYLGLPAYLLSQWIICFWIPKSEYVLALSLSIFLL